MSVRNPSSYLPHMVGPIDFQVDGVDAGVERRGTINLIGLTVTDDPDNDRTNVEATGGGGGGSPPTGTGPVTVTAGVQDAAAGTTTGTGAYVRQTSPVLITPSINNPADTFRYIVGGSAIAANRSVTLPLLTVDDTFVFAAHTQTLTNKTINGASNTISNVSLTAGVTGTLPVANGGTGIGALGAGMATWMGTPSSANLLAAMTDKTGTGLSVFAISPTFRTSILLNNPANTFAYTFTPAAIAAARTITLPLLTGNDTMVCEAFTQTLTNKTLTSPTIGGTPVLSGASTSTSNNAKGVEANVNPVNVQTTDATVTTLDSFTIASGSAVVVSWLVSAIQSTSANAAGYSVSAVFRNNAGTVTQSGTTLVTVIGESDATWDCTCDNSTTTIRLRVTGKAATTIQWTAILTRLTVVP